MKNIRQEHWLHHIFVFTYFVKLSLFLALYTWLLCTITYFDSQQENFIIMNNKKGKWFITLNFNPNCHLFYCRTFSKAWGCLLVSSFSWGYCDTRSYMYTVMEQSINNFFVLLSSSSNLPFYVLFAFEYSQDTVSLILDCEFLVYIENNQTMHFLLGVKI